MNHAVTELTGPYALGRVLALNNSHRTSASFLPNGMHTGTLQRRDPPFMITHYANAWKDRPTRARGRKPLRRADEARPLQVGLLLFGVVGRSIRKTWPHIQSRILSPLQRSSLLPLGANVSVLYFDIDADSVDGVKASPWESILSPPHPNSTRIAQSEIDDELRRMCAPAPRPGCVTQCAPHLACAPARCPPFVDPAQDAGRGRMATYDAGAMQNAYRALHAEQRVSFFLRSPVGRAMDVAIALSPDIEPLDDLNVSDVLLANQSSGILLGSGQNDRYGYTDGFLVGKPAPLARVTGRLGELVTSRLAAEGLPTDYEGVLKLSFDRAGLERRITTMRFVKVRATGKRAYRECLLFNETTRAGWNDVQLRKWKGMCSGRHLPERKRGATLKSRMGACDGGGVA